MFWIIIFCLPFGFYSMIVLVGAQRYSLTIWQESTTNWRFQEWLNNTLNNNTIRCKKPATIVSGGKCSNRKGSWYVFSTWNNYCGFLASYGVIIQSVIQSFLKMPICGASLSYNKIVFQLNNGEPNYDWVSFANQKITFMLDL